MSHRLRLALRRLPLAVTVVLVRDEHEVRGATVTSFMPVSLDPPLVAVSIGTGRWVYQPLHAAARFTVNLLAAGQEHLADHFSSAPRRERGVHSIRFGTTAQGLPSVDEALAVLECEPRAEFDAGDHTLVLAAVTGLVADPSLDAEDALLWADGGPAYLTLS